MVTNQFISMGGSSNDCSIKPPHWKLGVMWRAVTAALVSVVAATALGTESASAFVNSPIGAGVGQTILVCDPVQHTLLLQSTITGDGTTGFSLGEKLPQNVWLTVEYWFRSGPNAIWSKKLFLFDGQATTSPSYWNITLHSGYQAPGQYYFNAYYYWKQYNTTWSGKAGEHVVANQVIDLFGYTRPDPDGICTV